jgi:dimethylglycine dehydrogenase
VRNTVGIIDAAAFTKHLVRGPGATAFLDHFTCNKLPNVGRINLTYALTNHGTTRTEYTIVRLKEHEYYLISAGAWTAYDADFLMKSAEDFMAAGGGHIDIHDITTQWGVYALAGPNSRALLNDIVKDADPATVLSNKRFPWLSYRDIELGMCPVRAVRVAYTGELGWELHYPIEFGRYLWDLIWSVGEKHGLKGVGARAQNWLRQEKSYRAFGNELGRDATPLEADLPRFVDLSKDFNGKAKMVETGVRSKCCTLLIDGPSDADPWGKEALLLNGEKVGRLTSGGYSVAFGKQIGMGYVRPELAVPGTKLKVKMLRQEWDAVVVEDSPFDPTNARIRIDG